MFVVFKLDWLRDNSDMKNYFFFSIVLLASLYTLYQSVKSLRIKTNNLFIQLDQGKNKASVFIAISILLVMIVALILTKDITVSFLLILYVSLMIHVMIVSRHNEGIKGSFLYYSGRAFDLNDIKVIDKDLDMVILEHRKSYGVFLVYEKLRIPNVKKTDEFMTYIKTFERK